VLRLWREKRGDLRPALDLSNDLPQRDKSAEVGVAPGSNLEPAPAPSSQLRTTNPAAPPVREKLSAEESASAAAHLIQEIQTLPEDDLQPRAIAILKVKNRLLADDAKLVEEAPMITMTPATADKPAKILKPRETTRPQITRRKISRK
jgi:hypothetical protein